MRKLPLLLLLAACLQCTPTFSQNQAFKNAIHAKLNFLDYGILSDNDLKLGQGFEFAYFRNVAPALNVGVPLKLGLAKLPGSFDANTVLASADLQFRLENMKSSAKVVPFAFGGAGYVFEKDNNHAQFPFGAGLHFRVSPYAFVSLQGEYRKALVDDRDNLQIGIGYVYLLHKSEQKPVPKDLMSFDIDKDGTPDSLDLCPTVAGSPTALGCPDADNDGVGDDDDECPDDAGTIETGGCPDYDGDGFADKDDDCPTDAGILAGCPDTDMDGVADKDDRCPTEKGDKENEGCPTLQDRDGDGTPDVEDICPDKPGTNRGCPDSDGDGIADNYDDCPDQPGTSKNRGCPEVIDTDGDGYTDDVDPCPTVAGTENGCPPVPTPDPDSDGDGVPDKSDPCPTQAGALGGCPDSDGEGVADNLDKCPNTPGVSSNFGCPEPKMEKPVEPTPTPAPAPIPAPVPAPVNEKPEVTEARQKLATAARAVQFESAKAVLKNESYDVLDEVVAIMRKTPAYSLSISGYTDDVGDDEANLKLSQDRAKACYDYLIFRGIKVERIRYTGFGEARPIASNDTNEGREQNRRVEFELIVE